MTLWFFIFFMKYVICNYLNRHIQLYQKKIKNRHIQGKSTRMSLFGSFPIQQIDSSQSK